MLYNCGKAIAALAEQPEKLQDFHLIDLNKPNYARIYFLLLCLKIIIIIMIFISIIINNIIIIIYFL